jgi:hypothetical protein
VARIVKTLPFILLSPAIDLPFTAHRSLRAAWRDINTTLGNFFSTPIRYFFAATHCLPMPALTISSVSPRLQALPVAAIGGIMIAFHSAISACLAAVGLATIVATADIEDGSTEAATNLK